MHHMHHPIPQIFVLALVLLHVVLLKMLAYVALDDHSSCLFLQKICQDDIDIGFVGVGSVIGNDSGPVSHVY